MREAEAIDQQERATVAERYRKQAAARRTGRGGAASALAQGRFQRATGRRRFVQSTGTCGDVVDTKASWREEADPLVVMPPSALAKLCKQLIPSYPGNI